MTITTAMNRKEPVVVLQRLRPQDVTGQKLKLPGKKPISPSTSTKGTEDSNVKGRRLREHISPSTSTKGTEDSNVKGRRLKEQISPSTSTKGTEDSNVKGRRLREHISPSTSTKGTKDSNVKGRRLKEQISSSTSTKGTKDSNVKGRRLKEQDETTYGEITAPEDGVQGAVNDGESCLPAGEEVSKEHHCFRCSMNFSNTDTLILHLKSHGPIRRSCTLYEKEVCGTSLDDSGSQNTKTVASTSKQGESRSLRERNTDFGGITPSRSGQSGFPCNVCSKVFMQSNHLKLHMRSHSGSKTDKEQGKHSEDKNKSPLDEEAFIRMMKNVIEETAIKCFNDPVESNDLSSSSDETVDRVEIRADIALGDSNGLVDLKQQRADDLEQNLDHDSLDIKQEDDDGSGDGFDKNVVSVNSHHESFNCQNSFQNQQASIKRNSEIESSAGLQGCTSASDKHAGKEEEEGIEENKPQFYQCDIEWCSKLFSEEQDFKLHLNEHQKKRLFPCSMCDMQFPTKFLLKLHEKRHPELLAYKCTKCEKAYELNDDLLVHMSWVHPASKHFHENSNKIINEPHSYKCVECNVQFSDNDTYEFHFKSDHTRLPNPGIPTTPSLSGSHTNVCLKCNFQFSNAAALKQHLHTCLSVLEKEKAQDCSNCSMKFPDEISLERHMNLSHSKKLLKCPHCDLKFPNGNALMSHVKHHGKQSPIKSENEVLVKLTDADTRINSMQKDKLQNIRTSMDSTRTTFQCSQCDMHFRERNELQSHMKLNHASELESQHPEVNVARYGSAKNLQPSPNARKKLILVSKDIKSNPIPVPEKTSTAASPGSKKTETAFECSKCWRIFKDNESLQKHINVQHSPTPERTTIFKCLRCHKKLHTSSQFRSHLRSHRKRVCPVSDKTLATGYSLIEHLYLHESHKCDRCSSQFSSSVLLKKHLKRHDTQIHEAIEDRGNTWKQTTTGNQTQYLADAESYQNAPDSSSRIDHVENIGIGYNDDSEATSYGHLDDENLVTIDNDADIILSDDESIGNKENHDTEVFELVEADDEMINPDIVDRSTDSRRKLPSSVGGSKSPDISPTVNGSPFDFQDSVQQESDEIVNKSPKASLISSERKRILKVANQSLGPQQKKRKMLRVSFADDISDRESNISVYSENVERTMPKLLPEKLTVDSNKSIAPQNNVKHSSPFKDCYVSLTTLEDSISGSNANKISTSSNKNLSDEFHKRRQSPSNRICGGKNINDKNESPKFNKSLKTGDKKLSSSVEAKNKSTFKESNKFGARTRHHYFHDENLVNSSCVEDGQTMKKSPHMATSTPLRTNKINHIRSTDSSILSAKGQNFPDEGHSVEDMEPRNKLGLSRNFKPHLPESRNKRITSIEKEKLESHKPSTYTLKKKPSQLKVGRFKCNICGRVLRFLSQFRVHMKIHNGPLIHKCPICIARFPVRFLLGLHISEHFEKGIPQMISENKMLSLNKSPTGTSKNFSPVLNIPKEKTASRAQDHNASRAGESSFSGVFSNTSNASTTKIDRPTNQINSLAQNQSQPSETDKDHSSTLPLFDNTNESNGNHSSDEQFHQCDDSLDCPPSLVKDQTLEFACSKCDKRFTKLLKLKLHQSMHTGVGLYKCSYCDLMFHFKQSLHLHIKTHYGEKKYSCKYCGMLFEEYSVMVEHRTCHADGKQPFKCQVCPKAFALDSSLMSHMRLHMHPGAFICIFCNCFFPSQSKFWRHIVGHSEKKPFICKICKFSFNKIDACVTHIRKVHITKKEITLKCTQVVQDFVQIDQRIYKELQDFVKDSVRESKLHVESLMKSISVTDCKEFTGKKNGETSVPIDKELPEPILVDPRRFLDSFGKEICKAKANGSLSDLYSGDMEKKERYEKLCVEVRNVLTRMKRYSQIPIINPMRNQSLLITPTRQIPDPKRQKCLNISENKCSNNLADTSKNKQETCGYLNKSADRTPSHKGLIIQKSSEKNSSLDKQHKKTVQIYEDNIGSNGSKYRGEVYSENYLQTHDQTHMTENLNFCSFCDEGFASKTELRQHTALHAEFRIYPCTVCGRVFKFKHQLYTHVKKH